MRSPDANGFIHIHLTTEQLADIKDGLFRAADDIEDIDDPRHYTKEDLQTIKRKAKRWRKLAQTLGL